MLRTIKFCNKKVMELINDDEKKKIINTLHNKIENSLCVGDKSNRMLNSKTIVFLKKFSNKVTLSTYGKKYLLYIDIFDDKKMSIFIDRKNSNILLVPFHFANDIYHGTLIEGEITKSLDNTWLFYITDIHLYKNNFLKNVNLDERINILKNMFKQEFEISSKDDVCNIQIAEYFDYCYMKDMIETYAGKLKLYCSGLLFKNNLKLDKGTLYILPNNQNHNQNHNQNQNQNQNNNKNHIHNNNKNKISHDNNITKNNSKNNENIVCKTTFNGDIKTINLWLKKTDKPDVYFLSENKEPFIEKGLACIRTIQDSQKISKWFNELNSDISTLYVKCIWNDIFKKYEVIDLIENV